jgi:hypothetical protein
MLKYEKYVLVNNTDSNNRVELKAKTIKNAYEEALEILGWNIVKQENKNENQNN